MKLTKINLWCWLFCLNTTFVLPKHDGRCVVCHYGTIYIMYVKGCEGQVGWGGRDEAEDETGNLPGEVKIFVLLFVSLLT